MNRNLLILGAGQYGEVVMEIAKTLQCFERIDFLDDRNPIAVGKLSDYARFSKDYSDAIVAVGNPTLRLSLLQKLFEVGFSVVTLVSPQAWVSPSASIGAGTVVEPMAVIQANAEVGVGCLVCAGAVIKHDARVTSGCYLDCNSVVMPTVCVPEQTKVEACCVCREFS